MTSRKQSGTANIAVILTGALSTILGGIVLLQIEYSSFGPHQTKGTSETEWQTQRLREQLAELQKETEVLKAALQQKNRLVDQLAGKLKEIEMDKEQQKQRLLDQLADQQQQSLRQKQRLLDQLADQQQESEMVKEQKHRLSDRLVEQQKEVEKLTSDAVKPKRAFDSKLDPASIPRKAVVLYYRVPSQRWRQVEYSRIDEVTNDLKRLNIAFVRGPAYKDSGLSPLRVPLAIKPSPWTSYSVTSVGHRDRVMAKMLDWGIEARIEKPEEMDD